MLSECLTSLGVAIRHSGRCVEVIVVENGICEESAALLRAEFSWVRHIRIETNRGFTPALTYGLDAATAPWTATLNDDTTLEMEAVGELLAGIQRHPDAWAFGAQMRFSGRPDVLNSAGLEIDELGVAADRLLGQPVDTSETEDTEVFGVSGGAAVYRKQDLRDLGGFDLTFFGYLEDADLAWRARMTGLRSFYLPNVVVYHHHSATFKHGSPAKLWLVGRNRVRLLAKNAPTGLLLRRGWAMVAYDVGYVVYVAIRARSMAPLRGRLRGLREWRRYRVAGACQRAPVALAPAAGFAGALRRHRTWSS